MPPNPVMPATPHAELSPAKQALLERWRRGAGEAIADPQVIPRLAGQINLPLSFAQLRFWMLQQMQPNTTTYCIPIILRLQGALDGPALQESLSQIVARHAVLRTTFRVEDGEPRQVIAPSPPGGLPLPWVDLRSLPAEQREQQAIRGAADQIKQPFDLERGPLLFARLFQLTDTEHLLALTIHHIAADGWSLGVLYRELSTLYGVQAGGQASRLPELPLQYADFAVWQRHWLQGPQVEKELAFWKPYLEGAPAHVELPTDLLPPATMTYHGDSRTAVIGGALTKALRALSRQEEATLFMTLLAAFQTLLFRQSGQRDFIVGVPVASRSRPELEGLIGCFLNVLLLRADLGGEPSFRVLLRRVRATALAVYEHQDFPLERQLEALRPDRTTGHLPWLQVLFNQLNYAETPLLLQGLSVRPVTLPHSSVNADLEIYAKERGEEIVLHLVYRTDLFRPETVDQLLEQFHTLLAGIVSQPDEPLSRLPLLTEEHQERLRAAYRRRFPTHPFQEFRREEIEQSIPARFEQQVRHHPDRRAVQTERHSWTYGQLNQRANRLAHALIAGRGAGPERVALLLDHDAPMIAGILGVLKAGKTYVPLETSYPRARLAAILVDAGAHLLVTHGSHLALARELVLGESQLINLDTIETNTPADNLSLIISPDTLAYLIYTSGSTGAPKGVAQNHRNVLHFARVYANNLRLRAEDRLTLFSSYAFDAAVMDLFGALLNGATLYPHDAKRELPLDLLQALQREAITVFHSTPTLYRFLLGFLQPQEVLSSVRLVVLGGEEVAPRDLELYRRHFAKDCILINGLGPTEATIALQNFLRQDTPLTGHAVPIGYPVDGMEVLLLDDSGKEHGVWGEIALRSQHLALGYWNQPELTRERFLPDPDGGVRRVYRTGDLARRRPDGMFEFIGRKDQQVKMRGYRLELPEIEAALGRHPGVARAVVMARPTASGDRELVACVVPADAALLSAVSLRAHLRSMLPEFMIPAHILILDRLPLRPNGKLDWNVLAAVEVRSKNSAGEKDGAAPATPAELALGEIWSKVLGVEPIGRYDNFFDLGGNSLQAIRLVTELKRVLGRSVPLAAVFQCPTIESMARMFAEGQGTPSQWTSLVPLQPKGSKPPFYFVHGLGGGVFHFWDVALLLDADQPSYALLAVRDHDQPCHARVEEMAAHYAREIRIHQPQGPYYLGGYSAGGWIAYAIAQELRRQGQPVAMLALLDTYPSTLLPRWLCWSVKGFHLVARCLFHGQQFWRMKGQSRWQYFLGRLVALKHSVRRNYPRSAQAAPAPPADPRPASPDRDYYAEAVSQYQPAPYDSSVDLFVCEGSHVLHQRPFLWYLLRGGMNIHRVPGTHFTVMVDEDHLRAFSRVFAAALRQAQERARLSQAP